MFRYWKKRKAAPLPKFKPKREYQIALFDGGQWLGAWPLDWDGARVTLNHEQVMGIVEAITEHEHPKRGA